MSSSLKRSTKKKSSQDSEASGAPIYVKHRIATVKKLQKSISSLCDKDSSSPEDTRPFFLKSGSLRKNSTDKSADDSSNEDVGKKLIKRTKSMSSIMEESESDQDKQKTKRSHSKSEKHKNNISNKKRKSGSSNSENDATEKHAERKNKMSLMSKMEQKDYDLQKEDSSSGKEFQKSKISSTDSKLLKKISRIKETRISVDQNSGSTSQIEKTIAINKEQSILFKSRVVKILNRFKEMCSEYELQMEHVKWKHFKKELTHKEIASNIIQKSKDVIRQLKMKLETQEKELTDFYEEWVKNCESGNVSNEESSLSENEVMKKKENRKRSEKSKSSSSTSSLVSGCDVDEIFSGNETNVDETKKNKESVVKITEKMDVDNADNDGAVSPILAGNKIKETISKITTKKSSKTIEELERLAKECQNTETKSVANESVDDIFDDSTIENVDSVKKLKEDKGECKDDLKPAPKLGTEIAENNGSPSSNEDTFVNESADKDSSISSEEILETTKIEENNVSSEPDEEERAKRLMLESDSDTPLNDELLIENSTKESSEEDDLKEKEALPLEESILVNKQKKSKTQSSHTEEHSSSNEEQITEIENSIKHSLLESNSDDTMSSPDNKINTDEKLGSNNNSEDSSSNSDNESKTVKTDISSSKKRQKEKENCSMDKRTLDTKEQARLLPVNYARLDKRLTMLCKITVERLPENILEKHKNALERSKQHLESKEFRSLTNLDRLRQNRRSINDSIRQSPRSAKNSKTKEAKDSLLDHLKKVKDEESVENTEVANTENDDSSMKTNSFLTTEELIKEADVATKNILLHSSDSDIDEQNMESKSNTSDEEKGKTISKDSSTKPSLKDEKINSDKENDEEEQNQNKWRRNKLLTIKFSSDSDSSVARKKWNKKQEVLAEKKEEGEEEEDFTEKAALKAKAARRKRRNRRKIVDSDSEVQLSSDTESDASIILESEKSSDSDSSVRKQKKRKRKTRKSSDTDSSISEKRSKPKRKRIKNMSSDSDENSDQITSSQGCSGKKGRKNIRKVMKDKQVADDTKQAAKEEEERLKRIADRQKLYNEMYEARLADEEKVDKLVLDFNPETKEELVTVHETLVKRLKPHQAKGIKFMWEACFESLERIKSSTGSGCIIAHCMGLGKTLQVIALVHTLLTHEETGIKTVMIVCPLSTVLNWSNEFNLWLKDIEDNDINVYEMTKVKKNVERKYQLEAWQRSGGVLIIGYEMFRNLTGTNNKMRKNMKEAILKYLIDPGPDVIVCDEGHLLKNEDTALSKSIKRIKTLRRVILTGTPLQNNLIEYHCMVQFVKPNLLGTKKEFLNRFANPITNGQFDDSTEYDVKLMKKRAYVLHKMLKGCVQRFDYSVLTPFLPPKQEYVIFVSLSEVQVKLYRHYLENFARSATRANGTLFADFQALQRIWTHPIVLRLSAERTSAEKKFDTSDSEGSLKDFIVDKDEDDSTTSTAVTSSDDEDDGDDGIQEVNSNTGKNRRTNLRRNKSEAEEVSEAEESEKKEEQWWAQFIQPDDFEDMRISSKLMLLFGILKECEQIGDKVLVFSQSLFSLSLIEQFLERIDNETQNPTNSEFIDGHSGSWSLGLDYFRLDGQTSAENRNLWCRIFNNPSNTRARLFLISTRAGGLGINLTAANRVIIFDASWNPSHDVQSIFRVYRFGQKKPCYVYRFLAAGTMEEKIYNRQVTKLSLSCRVVDEQQIERHYSNNDLNELYKFEPNTSEEKPTLNLPKDRLLAEIFLKYKNYVENYHEHDSLLENKAEEELNEEERKQAWLEYEEEKKGKPQVITSYPAMAAFSNHMMLNQYNMMPGAYNMTTDYETLRQLLQKDYPNASPETQQMMTTRALTEMYTYWEQQAYHNTANRLLNQNAGVKPVQLRPAILSNSVRMNYVIPNTNQNVVNQQTDYRTVNTTRAGESDDDVVEVTSATVDNKNKNQEE